MISRIWIINGVLAIALVISGVKIWDGWHEKPGVFSEKILGSDEKKAKPVKMTPEKRLDGETQYADIVDKNLFSPDRAPAPPEPEGAEPEIEEATTDVKVSGEKVVLYGIVALDGYKKALTNDPSDQAVQFRWISEGDKIGNLAVREISEDNILLTDEGKSYRILLYDPEKAAKAGAKASAKPSVDSHPQVVSAGTPPRAAEYKPSAKQDSKQDAKVSAPPDTEDQYETVDTPFGKIRRKKK